MLTKGDDYPIHQTSLPVAYAGTDRNFFDRYFFNGYSPDGATYFAVALGVYPNINIMDASFSIIHEGTQHSLHASRVLNMERMETTVGPITVKILEPLQKLAVQISDNEYGIKGDLVFDGRVDVIEEPRFTHRVGPRTIFDYTRLTQSGQWTGWIEVEGDRIEISPANRFWGTRDRSWGVRPIGQQDPQPVIPQSLPQFFFLWAPLNFDDCSFFYAENAYADGSPWSKGAHYATIDKSIVLDTSQATSQLTFKSGTRHAKSGVLNCIFKEKNQIQIQLEPQYNFYQSGLGYLNFEWGHGYYKGENAVGYESWNIDEVDELDMKFWHVQAFCKARLTGSQIEEKEGVGILEQLIVGPHQPSGFKEILDVAP